MAASLSLLEKHLSCPVCSDIFSNPVVLKCSHSFCEECLQKYWKDMDNLLCPVCSKECSIEQPSQSLVLKSLCESFQRGSENEKGSQDICQQHREKLKLFCFDDKQPICVVCHISKKHKGHDCCPIEEALPDLKSEIQRVSSTLKKELENMNTARMCHSTWEAHIQGQAQCGEEQIREEFKKLHQFLEDEETARIAALRKEEQQKCQVMRKRAEPLTKQISTLIETIQMIKDMDVDTITFLQNYKVILNRAESTATDTADAEIVSGAFIDIAKHVGSLKFKVWKKMLGIVYYTSVTMDPNTVSARLILTHDLTTVTYIEERQNLPENPERLKMGVLGSEGYSKGRHFWDVEVGESDNWTLGVAKESIVRNKPLKMEPQSGLWSIRYISGKYRVCVKPRIQIKLDESPRVIRVRLDCDQGELTFSDPTKSTILYTFNDTFTEKVFPYFYSTNQFVPLRLLSVSPNFGQNINMSGDRLPGL
ncbi:E3 ubiquitin-protein ligase TRIM39-like [Salvelinus fontinalis]|uniref:E3 ubiquitin-protein ligase TRIM39-like n=1 Tax=Salvelinus fontinalis TaxID=8038 RepID=UPI00248500E0|nr:E3 ubiquitin-protein ligase TRIM39-like [Salvelinus fontinalis]